jgi:hypothetical protein
MYLSTLWFQKYHIYRKKRKEGTLKHSNSFVDEQQVCMDGMTHINSTWLYQNVPSIIKNLVDASHPLPLLLLWAQATFFRRMNSLSAFGRHTILSNRLAQLMSSQRNLGIPLWQDMETNWPWCLFPMVLC